MRPLIEAAEAFPAFEEAALAAESEILFGMRLFESDLPLTSDAARTTGAQTWAELLAVKAAAGVEVRVLLSDFEAIMAPTLHEGVWTALEGFQRAAEDAGASERLQVIASLHPGEFGKLARLVFWPAVRWRLGDIPRRAGEDIDIDRAPGLWNYLKRRGGSLKAKPWPRIRLWPATHHQKLGVFDGERAIVGGIDLARRMYDDAAHERAAKDTWHDVSLMTEGSEAEAVRRHMVELWNASVPSFNARLTRMGAPGGPMLRTASPMTPSPSAAEPSGFLRTRSRRSSSLFALGPKPDIVEIEAALLAEIEQANKLIYLETQFLRSPTIANALAEAARRAPGLEVVVLLPAAPDDIAFEGNRDADARHGEWLQWRAIRTIDAAFGDRAGIFSLARPTAAPERETEEAPRSRLAGAPIVYVHAKVAIFDGATAIVGSANLNGRSLRWDTEAALLWRDADGVSTFQNRLWRTHMGDDAPPAEAGLSGWRALADANVQRVPAARAGFVLPYDKAAARAFARRRPWMPTNML